MRREPNQHTAPPAQPRAHATPSFVSSLIAYRTSHRDQSWCRPRGETERHGFVQRGEAAVEQGGGQDVRERAGDVPGARARPVGARRGAAPRAHAAGGLGALPGAPRRHRPHHARSHRLPRVLGRRLRQRPPRHRQAPRRGTAARHPLVRRRAQAVSRGVGEVRARRLEEHLAVRGEDADADAGGEPRAEVLHPADQRRRPRLQAQKHPRHHHPLTSAGWRRRPSPAYYYSLDKTMTCSRR